jgi:hypothetical protein
MAHPYQEFYYLYHIFVKSKDWYFTTILTYQFLCQKPEIVYYYNINVTLFFKNQRFTYTTV